MTQSAAWLAHCERSYERSCEQRRDAADDADAYAEALTEEIRDGLSANERASIFDDAWADEGMVNRDLMAGLRSYWIAADDGDRAKALRTIGQQVLNFAEAAIDRRVEAMVAERIEQERYDAYRGGDDD
jgi:phosphopantothenate synthetase